MGVSVRVCPDDWYVDQELRGKPLKNTGSTVQLDVVQMEPNAGWESPSPTCTSLRFLKWDMFYSAVILHDH